MVKTKLTSMADLMRKGASLLKEPCPKCGGIQARYKNRTLCISCDDFSDLSALEAPSPSEVIAELSDLLVEKMNETSLLLKREADVSQQTQLVSLLLKYIELFDKANLVLEKSKQT